ncbi:MAG TPA: zf-HC2 domain-containing protein, partial [Thermoanaerobaculia bacterium]
MTVHHDAFPSDETLAALIDGRLDDEMRQRVIEHLASCDECRWTVSEAPEMISATLETDNVVRGRFRRLTAPLVAVAAAVLLILAFPAARNLYYERTSGMAALIEASKLLEKRPIPSRLSAPFPYKDFRTNRGEAEEDLSEAQLEYVAATARARASEHASPQTLRSAGVGQLLIGKHDVAVELLEGAIRKQTGETNVPAAIRASKDIDLVNDLAAAYLARGRYRNTAADMNAALEAAEQAYKLAPTSQAVLYNRALAYQQFEPLADRARKAWAEYLSHETDPQWRHDAERQLELLTPQSQ